MNKFKIIITSYNNETWTEMCVGGLINQTYKNFEVLFFDDSSTDKTYDIAYNLTQKDDRFTLIRLSENKTKAYIFANLLTPHIDNTDIVVFLDGDDWLANHQVLENINQFYNSYSPWVAYGGMVVWEGGEKIEEPYPQNSNIPEIVKQNKLYRKDLWRSSHIKTMRGFIWNSIDKSHFISSIDNLYILGPDDLVIMFDALEKCYSCKIQRFNFDTYIYNHCEENRSRIREHQTKRTINYESEIRTRAINNTLPIITCDLSGGVGNQLFQVAATITAANKFRCVAMFDSKLHFLPLQGNTTETYKNNIFKKIIFTENIPFSQTYTQNGFHFTDITEILPGTKLHGGFQSEKYFDPALILDVFSPDKNIMKELTKKYGDVSKKTSIHVRRGDYLKLYPHHIFVGEDYYNRAIGVLPNEEYVVFSDDIDWCKQFFKGNKFTFVKDTDYNELYLMSMCRNNIIGNSTFSWWGAYLNLHIDKQVIAPKNWFGPGYSEWNTSDLIPTTWIVL